MSACGLAVGRVRTVVVVPRPTVGRSVAVGAAGCRRRGRRGRAAAVGGGRRRARVASGGGPAHQPGVVAGGSARGGPQRDRGRRLHVRPRARRRLGDQHPGAESAQHVRPGRAQRRSGRRRLEAEAVAGADRAPRRARRGPGGADRRHGRGCGVSPRPGADGVVSQRGARPGAGLHPGQLAVQRGGSARARDGRRGPDGGAERGWRRGGGQHARRDARAALQRPAGQRRHRSRRAGVAGRAGPSRAAARRGCRRHVSPDDRPVVSAGPADRLRRRRQRPVRVSRWRSRATPRWSGRPATTLPPARTRGRPTCSCARGAPGPSSRS